MNVGVAVLSGVLVGLGVAVGHFFGCPPLGIHPAVGGGFVPKMPSLRIPREEVGPKTATMNSIATNIRPDSRNLAIMRPPSRDSVAGTDRESYACSKLSRDILTIP